MSRLLERIMEEVREVIPPTVFFFFAFLIISVSRALLLRQYGVQVSVMAGVVLAALLVGKVVLLADMLPFVNRFPEKPLMYNVLWKTAIYTVAALLAHYLEHLVPIWWREGEFVAAQRHLAAEIVWPHFWVIQMWLVVLLFLYCSLRELIRAIGRERVVAMFLGGRSR
jgi:hypothetical protein